jgi:hypothetical protein
MWMLVLLILWSGAAAQDLTSVLLDPGTLGGNVLALAGLVLTLTQVMKTSFSRRNRKLPWWGTLLVSVALGQALAAVLFYAGFGARFGAYPPPWTWVLYGLLASGVASGGRDFVTRLVERWAGARVDVMAEVWPIPAPAAALTPEAAPLAPEDDLPDLLPGFLPESH